MPIVTIDGLIYVPQVNIKYAVEAKTLGEAFMECRKHCNLSLDKAANYADISKSHLWAIEKNSTEPSLWIAASLARLYGIDLRSIAELPRTIIDY